MGGVAKASSVSGRNGVGCGLRASAGPTSERTPIGTLEVIIGAVENVLIRRGESPPASLSEADEGLGDVEGFPCPTV